MIDGEASRTVEGDVSLATDPRLRFDVASSERLPPIEPGTPRTVEIPAGSPLDPPTRCDEPSEQPSAVDRGNRLVVDEIVAGDLARCDRIVMLAFGTDRYDVHWTTGIADVSIPGWSIHLADVVDQDLRAVGVDAVIEATSDEVPPTLTSVAALQRHLFLAISLLQSREVGVGPMWGLDASGRVMWAQWGAPRYRPERPGSPWCPIGETVPAFSAISAGLARLGTAPVLSQVVDRSINMLLVADSSVVLEARIPVACSALETLAWAVLQSEEWATATELERMTASGMVRLLLAWSGIPTTLPPHMQQLHKRRANRSQDKWGGPEVLFNVRNRLVHPPKKLDSPEWPEAELVETWQLATWYLQLVILRLLKYEATYLSRLELGGTVYSGEPVPWTT